LKLGSSIHLRGTPLDETELYETIGLLETWNGTIHSTGYRIALGNGLSSQLVAELGAALGSRLRIARTL